MSVQDSVVYHVVQGIVKHKLVSFIASGEKLEGKQLDTLIARITEEVVNYYGAPPNKSRNTFAASPDDSGVKPI